MKEDIMKKRQIHTLYVIHHSHTDIGYTDLQERVIDTQADYISTVLTYMKDPALKDFRWNCETLFCVEKFLEQASPEQKDFFFELARNKQIGLSANYLNFNDLLDSEVFFRRLHQFQKLFADHSIPFETAMFADINGVSMGYRDALLDCGIRFLYTNIHCHHGMYPLYQNQTAFFWESRDGRRLLVWNGEHYNLGNVIGLQPGARNSWMQKGYLGKDPEDEAVENLYHNLSQYLDSCESQGYPYDFIPASVSGVFSDNAPPNPDILRNIEAFNRKYGDEVTIRMVSLGEFYDAIRDQTADAPVYRGDFTDWWANGVGSTPGAVKHYRNAQHLLHLTERLNPEIGKKDPESRKKAEDGLLLYAEHTWGHSSTVSNPCDTMVNDLDIRKTSYASIAHENASHLLDRIRKEKGDLLRYYALNGKIHCVHPSGTDGTFPVSFYIETMDMPRAKVLDADGSVIPCQVSPHPRGRMITFLDHFGPFEEKDYTYERLPEQAEPINTRQCYIGAEHVRDIVNTYDPVSFRLPYSFENRFFRLTYEFETGITSLVDKRTGKNLTGLEEAPLFTPIYEKTPIREKGQWYETPAQMERRLIGRNMKGWHAERYTAVLKKVTAEERGPIFTTLRFQYELPGTIHADVIWKLYEGIPRIDVTFEIGKTLSENIESVYLPIGIRGEDLTCVLRKGKEAFRPGIDQIPGTCMEFYMSDEGVSYLGKDGGAQILMQDTPLVFMGDLKPHPIRLCDGKEENNRRPLYSWVMNNIWETNFRLDLSGFGSYRYSLWLTDETNPEKAMDELKERTFDPFVLITG